METKNIVELIVGVAMVVIIGFAVIAIVKGWLNPGGIFEDYLEDLFNNIFNKANTAIS